MLSEKFNPKQIARLGPRATYGQALLEFAKVDDSVIAMSADLGNSSGLDRFRATFPNRFINVGIAEQNLVGVASGISQLGYVPYASSFAPFLACRALEQIRMNLGYMASNVKLVAIGSGISMGYLGNSHFGLEDAGLIHAIPGITIISPADCIEVVNAVEACAKTNDPTFIRLTGLPNSPMVYEESSEFEIGKAVKIRPIGDITFVASGSMVATCLSAANILEETGLSVGVVNMHTLRPLDETCLTSIANQSRLIVSAEEHAVTSGLNSVVGDFLQRNKFSIPLIKLGLPPTFLENGSYEYLIKRYELDADSVARKISEEYKRC
jgi:transketolase